MSAKTFFAIAGTVLLIFLFVKWLQSDRKETFLNFSCFLLFQGIGEFDKKVFFPAKKAMLDKDKPLIIRIFGGSIIGLILGTVILFCLVGSIGRYFSPILHSLLTGVGK